MTPSASGSKDIPLRPSFNNGEQDPAVETSPSVTKADPLDPACCWAARRCSDRGSATSTVGELDLPKRSKQSESETVRKHSFGIKGLFKKISRLGTGRKGREADDSPSPARRIVTTRDFSRLYELGEELMEPSRGGTEVRHAKRKKDGMPVIVKVRRKGKYGEECCAFASSQDEQEWRRSTEVVLNLPKHPHLTYLNEVLEDGGAYYVVMEKAHGVDLFEASRRQRGPSIVPPDIREIMRQVLEALAALHAEGCLHRDLKLDNVVLDRSRRPRDPTQSPSQAQLRCSSNALAVKIVDFDDAQVWPLPAEFLSSGKPRCIVGTDQYIAPEAYTGDWSPASDIFAAGVMLFRLLNARFPFDPRLFDDAPGENYVGCKKMEEIRQKIEGSVVDFFRRARGAPETDAQAVSLCRRMIAMDPRDRPSAYECLEDKWFCPEKAPGTSLAQTVVAPPEHTAPPPAEPGPLMPSITPRGQQAAPTGKVLAEAVMSGVAVRMQVVDSESNIEVNSSTIASLPGCVIDDEIEAAEAMSKKASRDRVDSGSTFSGGTTRAGLVTSSRASSNRS